MKFPPRTSRTTEIRLASATARSADETSITPKQTVSARTRPRWSRHRAGAAEAGCGGGGGGGGSGDGRRRSRGRERHRRERRGCRPGAGDLGAFRAVVPDSSDAAREAELEAPLLRGGHLGAVHRVRRMCHRVPSRRARLQGHRGCVQAVPARGGLAAPTTAATARRAARRAPVRAPASAPGSPRSTSSCSAGRAPPRSRRASSRTSCSPVPPTRCSPRSARTAASCRPCSLYALEHDMIDAALVSYLEGDGTSWKAIPGVARTKDEIIASAGSRYTYSANTMAYPDAIESGAERIALVGMSCQSSVPPVMKQRKAGKVARRLVAQHRAAVLQDLRRRHLRRAVRGQVRPEEVRDEEDEHQGRLPDLDEQR